MSRSHPTASLSDWRFPETEESAWAFNRFQSRLVETGEYKNVEMQPLLVARVDKLVAAMQASPALRGLCFAIADNALQHCGDRIALGLHDMEMAQIDLDAASEKYSLKELFVMGEGFFKLNIIDKLVVAKIKELYKNQPNGYYDEIEIRLAFHKQLADILDLPATTRFNLFGAPEVTPRDIQEAEKDVKQALACNFSVDFIARWTPWKNAMQRLHPEAYRLIQELQEVERDSLSVQPPRTTEFEWMKALKRLKNREVALEHRVTLRLTRQFLETYEPGA